MKIIELKTNNIKNLKAVELRPEGNNVVLTGNNGAGKSAVLDSILTTLTGKKLEEIIRKGEDKAEVSIDLGDIRVVKKWTEKGARLEVYRINDEGKPVSAASPQTLLNELIGRLSFDPLEFSRLDEKKQKEALSELVGLDLEDIDQEYKSVYDERTFVNRELKEAEAIVNGMQSPKPDTPTEKVSLSDQVAKVEKLKKARADYEMRIKERDQLDEQIGRIEAELATLKEKRAGIEIPPETPLEAIKTEEAALGSIETQNAEIDRANRYREAKNKAVAKQKEAQILSDKLGGLKDERQKRIAEAKYPIEGLAISEDGQVLFNEIPFSRLSTGQKIRVSTAMAMALNPSLRVIFIKEGSLLDDEGFNEIYALAKDKDYQVWVEKVDSRPVGVHLEQGEVKSAEYQKTKEDMQKIVDANEKLVKELNDVKD